MEKFEPDRDCAMLQFVTIFAGKWSIPILYRLIEERQALRFGMLLKQLAPITQKELSKHLKLFVQLGLVQRHYYAEIPPRVEYQVTELGLTLKQPLQGLSDWMTRYRQMLHD